VYSVYNDTKERTFLKIEVPADSIEVLQYRISGLIEILMNNEDISKLRDANHNFIESVNQFYGKVESGIIKVDSTALLRAIKDVTCRDIANQLSAPSIDRMRVVRDLRLFSNTVRYVLNPKPAF